MNESPEIVRVWPRARWLAMKAAASNAFGSSLGKIAEKKQSALSMMPDDITKTMTIQELVDVVEYLQLQK